MEESAEAAHVEAGFALLDEVFHLAALAVETNQILRRGAHIGHNEGAHVEYLTVGLLKLADDTAGIIPRVDFVQKLSIHNCIRDSILLRQII